MKGGMVGKKKAGQHALLAPSPSNETGEKTMKRWIVWVAVVSLGAAVLSSESAASVTFYTDRNAFLSVLAEPADIVNFEGVAPSGGYAFADGYTTNGVTFNDLYGYLLIVDPAYAPSYYDWNSGASAISYYYGDPVQA